MPPQDPGKEEKQSGCPESVKKQRQEFGKKDKHDWFPVNSM
jgi:hypothetical protein